MGCGTIVNFQTAQKEEIFQISWWPFLNITRLSVCLLYHAVHFQLCLSSVSGYGCRPQQHLMETVVLAAVAWLLSLGKLCYCLAAEIGCETHVRDHKLGVNSKLIQS